MLKGVLFSPVLSTGIVVSPSRTRITFVSTQAFVATGGTAPYVYTLAPGAPAGTSVNAGTGLVTSGGNAGGITVIATDALLATGQVDSYVALPISTVAGQHFIEGGLTVDYSTASGVPPYAFSTTLSPTRATINVSTGILTGVNPTPSSETGTVTVRDAYGGSTTSASVFALKQLEISPVSTKVKVSLTKQFKGRLGSTVFSYSVPVGGGSIDVNGLYTAPAAPGSATVRTTDSLTVTADASVLIYDLELSPHHFPEAVLKNTTRQFTGGSGTAPYTYSKQSGIGSIDAAGLYTAPNSTGVAVLRVTDSLAATFDNSIKVTPLIDRSTNFNGATSIGSAGNILSFERTNSFSISAWCRGDYLNQYPIIGKIADVGGGVLRGWGLLVDGGAGSVSQILLVLGNNLDTNNAIFVKTSTAIQLDTWAHIVATYNGSSQGAGVHIYINGVDESVELQADGLVSTIVHGGNVEFGAAPAVGFQGDGNTCSSSVYNRVLTQLEVTELYNSGSPGDVSSYASYSSCLNYWKMGQGDTLPTLTDTKSGQNITMTDGAITIGSAP